MITIYNSNLDFDLDSSNSITLSSTSNMVFKTNGSDKLTILNNGISVDGNVIVSGLITSTGAGFSGIGANLTNIPISAINELRLELNGSTTDLSVTRDALNASIVSEARFGSNYTGRINSELNTRVDNTSNYALATSNILIGRIINTSNYVDSTSNILIGRIDNTSNYIFATSNTLIGRIINTSNYVDSTSNFLSGRIDNTSNYALATSNILIGRIDNTSNYIFATSNTLIGRIINTSNYVDSTSNILIGRIDNTSNYIFATSNTLIGRIINTSNYVDSTSNILIGRIDNTSNYIFATSNTLIGRIINASNYVDRTSNILIGRIDNTSNYIFATSNTLIGRIINASNYVDRINTTLTSAIALAGQWTTSNANIYYNTSNVGIGTFNPLNNLHLYSADNKCALTIQNNYQEPITFTSSSTIVGNTGNYKYIIFPYTTDNTGAGQTQYTINVQTGGVISDILLVGGGGGGGGEVGGGGGGGAVLYGANINVPSGSYNIKVGKGGSIGVNGSSTEAFGATCLGGGAAKDKIYNTSGDNNGNTGGSGGGGKSYNTTGTAGAGGTVGTSTKGTLLATATLYNGNVGGAGSWQNGGQIGSGGGGGAGTAGGSGKSGSNPSGTNSGGDGVAVNITGSTYYWGAGGGSGSFLTTAGNGGRGGGGAGTATGTGIANGVVGGDALNTASGMNAASGSGSGGGGGGFNPGGNGGSGIIIIRYIGVLTSSSIEFIRGVSSDTNVDYKIGNYTEDFKIISSVSSVDTDVITIRNNGNVGIGTTPHPTYKLDIAGSLNATSLFVNGTSFTTTIGLKQDVLTSANTIGIFNTTTDFAVNGSKIELTNNTSNYVDSTSNLLSRRIDSTSNYVDRVGVWGSNYSDRVGVWGSNYSDRVSVWGSNYSDRVSVWGSNYSDRVSVWGSNYSDRVGELSSNYILVTSNILIGRIINTSNYVSSYKPLNAVRADTATTLITQRKIANVPFDGSKDISISYNNLDNKLQAGSGISIDYNVDTYKISATYASVDLVEIFNTTDFANANSKIELTKNTSNYVLATSNTLIGRIINTSNYVDSTSNFLSVRIDNTSNYTLATSNTLIGRIINTSNYVDRINTTLTSAIALAGQWTTSNANIYYNTSNVGIGTFNPLTKLHIFDNSINETKLTIQTNPEPITSTLSPSVGNTGVYRYIIFSYTTDNTGTGQTQYTINAQTGGVVCDILLVGGGGGGGGGVGGGGGGGAVLYGANINVPSGSYNIKVGKGGGAGVNGSPTEAFGATCLGGGAAKNKTFDSSGDNNGNTGGSGGGGKSYNTNGTAGAGGTVGTSTKGTLLATATLYNGNVGGVGSVQGGGYITSGGGGGANGEGKSAKSGSNPSGTGNGGDGVAVNITGSTYYWGAGGGSGSFLTPAGNGGLGGGGAGIGVSSTSGVVGGDALNTASGMNAASGSGSGGGGGDFTDPPTAGSGGSGIIIIRYIGVLTSSSIEFIRGVSSDSNVDYKIGNYTGDFKIFSSVSSVDTDVITIRNNGNVGIGTTPHETYKLDVAGSLNATSLFVNGTSFTTTIGLKQDVLTSANTIGIFNTTTDFAVNGSKIELTNNTSNYVLATSNILIGRVINTSNYVSSYKPATAVRADTATTFFTSRKIANVPFDGSADISISYNNLDNKLQAGTGISIDYNVDTYKISATYASADLISIFNTTDFANVNSKIELSKNTSNYVLATSNILIGRVINTSNYVDRINTTLTTAIAGKQNTLSAGSGISIVGNQISASASAQVQSDWNATSGVSFILNKPSIPANIWNQYGSDAYYTNNTLGNVGIGTNLPETFSRLHLYSADYSATKLTIQNNYSASPSGLIYSTFSPLIRTTGNHTYMIFYYTNSGAGGAGVGQTRYNVTIPTGGSTIDILMVGGGGNGGSDIGGGGGGGAVLYGTNITIPAGSYNIDVGNGGVANAENGYSTTAFGATCLGGGSAKNKTFDSSGNNDGNTGGSGGGGKSYNQVGPAGAGGTVGTSTKGTLLAAATLYNGNVGGVGSAQGGGYITSGGGGGANGEGKSAKSGSNPSGTGNGGDGVAVNITGSTYYWGAGGGSGSFLTPAGNGGLGGGGAGTGSGSGGTNGNVGTNALNTASGMNAASMSGSGGGGGSFTAGGAGGSGVVIIKYSLNSTTSSIEFIRGSANDTNTDYKIGNYTGEFKIISSVSNSDTDFVKITPNGGISNPTGTSSWTTTSDRRIKENIEKASYDICYDNINKLDLYRFNYIRNFNNVNKDVRQLGYIAQEVKEIFPKAVSSHNFTNNDINIPDLLSIDITQINYSLYGAVKKLIEMNEDNLFRINKLIEIDEDKENRIKNLEFALNTSNILII